MSWVLPGAILCLWLVLLPYGQTAPSRILRRHRRQSACATPFDISIVMDTSKHVTSGNVQITKDFVKKFVSSTPTGSNDNQYEIITSGDKSTLVHSFADIQTTAAVSAAVDGAATKGGSRNTAAGVALGDAGLPNGRANAPNVLVLVSNGDAADDLLAKVKTARDHIAYVYIVEVGSWVSGNVKKQAKLVMTSPDYSGLNEQFANQLRDVICNDLGGNPCASTPCSNGGVCETDLTKYGRYNCSCVFGITGLDCGIKCHEVDVGFILDASGSVKQENWDNSVIPMVQAVVDLLPVSPAKAHVGSVTFSLTSQVDWTFQTTQTKTNIDNKINTTLDYPAGKTCTACGMEEAINSLFDANKGDRTTVNNVAILYTDGNANTRAGETATLAADLHKKAATYCVAVGSGINDAEIDLLASDPDSTYAIRAKDFAELLKSAKAIADQICYESDPCVNKGSNPCLNGGTCDSSSNTVYTCTCAVGYTGTNCENQSCDALDICFVVDASASIPPGDWPKILYFLSNATDSLQIGSSSQDVNAGVVVFSSAVKTNLRIKLSQGTSQQQLKTAIEGLVHDRMGTETDVGLDVTRNDCFNAANGDRGNNPDMALVLTDGASKSYDKTAASAKLLRDDGVRIYAVGIKGSNEDELNTITGDPNMVILANSFDDLQVALRSFLSSACGVSDPCKPNPCMNGGTCSAGGGGQASCACTQFWSGPSCTKPICEPNPCTQKEKCVPSTVSNTGYICECIDATAGANCEVKDDCDVMDLCLVLDSSYSVGKPNWELMKDFLVTLFDSPTHIIGPANMQVGLVDYSSASILHSRLNMARNKAELDAQIGTLPYYGYGTATHLGLKDAREKCLGAANGMRATAKRLVLLITDGISTDTPGSVNEANLLRASGTTVAAVGVNLGPTQREEVKQIVDYQTDKMFFSDSFSTLLTDVANILKLSCPGPPPPKCGNVDICFTIDSSYSLGEPGWTAVKGFVNEVTKTQDLSAGTQVGVVTYSSQVALSIRLNQYQFVSSHTAAVSAIAFMRQGTNTHLGLQTMTDECFSQGNGHVPANKKIGILVTDGASVNKAETQVQAKRARDAGIDMYAIGIKSFDLIELTGVVGGATDHVFTATDFNKVTLQVSNLVKSTCAATPPCE